MNERPKRWHSRQRLSSLAGRDTMSTTTTARTAKRQSKATVLSEKEATAKRADVGAVIAQAEADAAVLALAETVDASDLAQVQVALSKIGAVESRRDAAKATLDDQAQALAGLVKAAHRARWVLLARAYDAAGAPAIATFGGSLGITGKGALDSLRLHVTCGIWVLLDSDRDVTIEAVQDGRLGSLKEAKAARKAAAAEADKIKAAAEAKIAEAKAKAAETVKAAEAKAEAGESVDVVKVKADAAAKAAKAVKAAAEVKAKADAKAGRQAVRTVSKAKAERRKAAPLSKAAAERTARALIAACTLAQANGSEAGAAEVLREAMRQAEALLITPAEVKSA